MDFILVALTVSLVYAILPANIWRLVLGLFVSGGLSRWHLGWHDPWHTLTWGFSAYFVAYALNSLVDSWAPAPQTVRRRLRSDLPSV